MHLFFFGHKLIKHNSHLEQHESLYFLDNYTSTELDVGEKEGRLSRQRILSRKAFLLLTSTNDFASLAALVKGNDLNLLVSGSALQTANHLTKDGELVKRQLAIEDGVWILTALYQAALETLNERHGLLHLAQLADLGIERLVVDGDAQRIKGFAHKVNVLFLPGGVLLGSEDGKLLGLTGVKGQVFALGKTLGEVGLGRQDVGGCATDIGLGGRSLRRGLWYLRELGIVNSLGLNEC